MLVGKFPRHTDEIIRQFSAIFNLVTSFSLMYEERMPQLFNAHLERHIQRTKA